MTEVLLRFDESGSSINALPWLDDKRSVHCQVGGLQLQIAHYEIALH